MATSATLRAAVLGTSEDTGRTLSILSHLGAPERNVFLETLRPLNVARWAVLVHRLSTEPAYQDEFTSSDIAQARNLARNLLVEAG
ncbi:MAG: hypothetical protein WC822_07110 [Candidatus Paceibacterota bacterium]|jgi:hypothetical protein